MTFPETLQTLAHRSMAVVCFVRGVWRTFFSGVWLDGDIISGHDGQEREDGSIYCTTCWTEMD